MKLGMIVSALAVVSTLAYAAEPITSPDDQGGTWKGLELGTRILHIQFLDDEQGTGTSTRDDNFIGSLDRIDENQDYVPNRFYAQYFAVQNFGVGISYDAVEAKTLDNGGGDGNVGVNGPILYLVGRYPTQSDFVPFAEIGVAFYHAYFDENSWSNDDERRMENEDTEALVLGLGVDYLVTPSLSFNLYARLVNGATVDVEHWNKGSSDVNQEGDFTLDYYGFGIGVKYAFQ